MEHRIIREWLDSNPGSACVGKVKVGGETNAVVIKNDRDKYEVGDLYDVNGSPCYMPRGVLHGLDRDTAIKHACNIAGVPYDFRTFIIGDIRPKENEEERELEVALIPGSTVHIVACYESFEQYGATIDALYKTLPLAEAANDWLHYKSDNTDFINKFIGI